MYRKILKYNCIVFLLVLISCKKEKDNVNIDFGYNYFPTDTGRFIIYKVDSIIFNSFSFSYRTNTVYLKEKIESHFLDNQGRKSERIERYYKNNLSDAEWRIDRIWYQTVTKQRVERIEENLRYVRMVFPNYTNATWFGNKYIDTTAQTKYLYNWEYKIKEKDIPTTLLNNVFDSTLRVGEIVDSNPVYCNISNAVYAKNIGQVYRELWILTNSINPVNPNSIAWPYKAQNGFVVKQYAIEYGVE